MGTVDLEGLDGGSGRSCGGHDASPEMNER
jgi:hypothetical protein